MTAVTVRAVFFDQVSSEGITAAPFLVNARSQTSFDNVLQSLFGKALSDGAYGPIRFETSGPILVSASVNNVNACGFGAVSGQWLPGIDSSRALTEGVIGQLAISESAASGYRTNLVVTNPGEQGTTVTVKVRAGDGGLLSTMVLGPLASNGFLQVGLETFPGVEGMSDENLWIEFSSGQPVIAYATVIDNASGDPFAIMASDDTPSEVTVSLPGGVPLVMVRVPAGTFQMGSPESERGRYGAEVLREVTLTRTYFIGKYEVTQGQWAAVMGTKPSEACQNPSPGIGGSFPVNCVSWDNVVGEFIPALNDHLAATGQPGAGKFRLPTEAEWERAARGGTQTRFSFGNALDGDDNCGENLAADPYVWWCANDGRALHPVGMKLANPFGLFDVHGNAQELVADYWVQYPPSTPQTDPTGPSSGTARVRRDEGWGSPLFFVRSAMRGGILQNAATAGVGFRLARSK